MLARMDSQVDLDGAVVVAAARAARRGLHRPADPGTGPVGRSSPASVTAPIPTPTSGGGSTRRTPSAADSRRAQAGTPGDRRHPRVRRLSNAAHPCGASRSMPFTSPGPTGRRGAREAGVVHHCGALGPERRRGRRRHPALTPSQVRGRGHATMATVEPALVTVNAHAPRQDDHRRTSSRQRSSPTSTGPTRSPAGSSYSCATRASSRWASPGRRTSRGHSTCLVPSRR